MNEQVNTIIIDGRKIANSIKQEIKKEVKKLEIVPTLGIIFAGGKKDSEIYVRMKKIALKKAGMGFVEKKFTNDCTTQEIITAVKEFNEDDNINGILVQLPLPEGVDQYTILSHISLDKDVDGCNPLTLLDLILEKRSAKFVACTPLGALHLIKSTGIEIAGKKAVVIGRSNIVGLPMAFLLIQEAATVTVCDKNTRNIQEICKDADILVSATGCGHLIKKDWIKPGAVVIDIGICPVKDKTKKRGYKIIGDVDFDSVQGIAGYITPVPGGCGARTISALMENLLKATKKM